MAPATLQICEACCVRDKSDLDFLLPEEDFRSTLSRRGCELLGWESEEEAAGVIAQALTGSTGHRPAPLWDWVLGMAPDDPRRMDVARWTAHDEFSSGLTQNGGIILGLRTVTAESKCSPLQAVCIAFRRPHGMLNTLVARHPPAGRVSQPPSSLWDEHPVKKRWTAVQSSLANLPAYPVHHWYVADLRVDPCAQGQGLGTHLVNVVADLAEQEAVPCFLEAAGERNHEFYLHRGFKDHFHVKVIVADTSSSDQSALEGNDAIDLWSMVRLPNDLV
mmetsp:Transcript_22102/g.51598  ORF Transcript_22102/g.51598 Transcript_22102/m.51598 type:complete len:276 (-) Transcript_22102:136-963(-)